MQRCLETLSPIITGVANEAHPILSLQGTTWKTVLQLPSLVPWQGNLEVRNVAFLPESFWKVQTGQNRPKDLFLWLLSWFCVVCVACSNTSDNCVAGVYSKVRREPQQVAFF